jgi:hypothetical protein
LPLNHRSGCCLANRTIFSGKKGDAEDAAPFLKKSRFPASNSGTAVTYTVNNVYSDEYGGINEPEA